MNRVIKLAMGGCLLGMAVGLTGPDGNRHAWQNVLGVTIAAVCLILMLIFAALFWYLCREARYDVELSVEEDSKGMSSLPTRDSDPAEIYNAGLIRGRAMAERASRMRPAEEVCGTAE